MAELREVLRTIPGPNGDIQPGTVVDVSSWRMVRQLVAAGKLGPIMESAPEVLDLSQVAEKPQRPRKSRVASQAGESDSL